MTKQEFYNLRDMIDGELNRIMVTDDKEEIAHLKPFLERNIKKLIAAKYNFLTKKED